jgi:predicted PurR-regulated permease PerM
LKREGKMSEKTVDSHDVAGTVLQVLVIGLLIAAVVWILRPFITSIIWATMIVVATWPVLLAVQARMMGIRSLAVVTMTVILLMVVVIPLLLAIIAIIEHAGDVSAWAKSLTAFTMPPPPEWLGRIPLAGPKLAEYWRQFGALNPEKLADYFVPYARQVATWFMAQVGSLVMVVIQFLLTVIMAVILYAKGESASAGILSFARRLGGQQGEEVTILAAKAIRGVALGVAVTAILQATVGGIGLAVAGVPAASLLTGVMFMLCLAQVGPTLVLAPAVIWIYWRDGVAWGTILLVFSVAAMTLDNFVRPALIRKGADLPLVLIFGGVIGGLIAFGIVGLFIGPVLLAVSYTLLKAWVSDGA